MAVTKKAKSAPKKATLDDVMGEISGLSDAIVGLVGVLKDQQAAPVAPVAAAAPVAETPEEKAIEGAGPKKFQPINSEWQAMAEEILGDALDHCEVDYPKAGGTIFTLVIKRDKSNAPEQYLELHKEDRRSKEIGNEGIQGVEQWCKLVKQNLNKPR